MQEIIISILGDYGYIGVMLLIAIENIFPPIPSEVILTFSGFMTTYSNLNVVLIILFATIGSVGGALVLYYVGKIFNKEKLKKIVTSKYGKLLCLKPRDIEKADKWFDNKGNKSVFFCRFIPIIRSLVSIPAGMSEMPMPKFILYTLSGTLIWNSVLVLLGHFTGESWEDISKIMDKYSFLVVIIILLIIVIGGILFYKNKIKKKNK